MNWECWEVIQSPAHWLFSLFHRKLAVVQDKYQRCQGYEAEQAERSLFPSCRLATCTAYRCDLAAPVGSRGDSPVCPISRYTPGQQAAQFSGHILSRIHQPLGMVFQVGEDTPKCTMRSRCLFLENAIFLATLRHQLLPLSWGRPAFAIAVHILALQGFASHFVFGTVLVPGHKTASGV